ncbi:hypothetical protein HOA92_00930 [archaeon]|jgi:intergrase/recombinase|nr:hypothetical protein [archaeon]MBT6761582.1 hypothetical protein [archaeon]
MRDLLSFDAYYKALRAICNFYEEKHLGEEEVLKELNRIRKIAKRKKSNPDVYTPEDSELFADLAKIKELSTGVYNYYLGLINSGVRISEFAKFAEDPSKYRIIDKGEYIKVYLNYRRGSKNCLYIYLPKGFDNRVYVSYNYFIKFFQKHRGLIRPKYIRNWFYSKCLQLGIPSGVADFYQGRSAVSIGDRHYLDKERMADEKYRQLIGQEIIW